MTADSSPEPSDAELLEQFLSHRSHAAFELLVRRFGPMVNATCRRILGSLPDAEDAFQATFIVLSLKAAAIRPRSHLGPWLHGVAVKTSLKARSDRSRRQVRESTMSDFSEIRSEEESNHLRELIPLLDIEIAGLPSKYRDVILLCDLQQLTHADAAKRLGSNPTTVSVQLTRGRRLLADRLRRRCRFALSMTALITALNSTAQAELSPALIEVTTQSAVQSLQNSSTTASQPTTLAQGVIKTMSRTAALRSLAPLLIGLLAIIGLPWTYSLILSAQAPKTARTKLTKLDREIQQKLQGKWFLTSLEVTGESIPLNQFSAELLIDDDLITLQSTKDEKPRTDRGHLVIDSSSSPWQMDWIMEDNQKPGGFAGSKLTGIFRIENESLQFSFLETAKTSGSPARPKEFETRPDDSNSQLLTFSRQPAKPSKQPSAPADDFKPLQGEWPMIGMELAGRAFSPEDIQRRDGKLTITTEQFTLTMKRSDGSLDSLSGRLQIDPSKNPMHMDWMEMKSSTGKAPPASEYVGIYKFENEELHFSFAPRTSRSPARRPLDFLTTPNTQSGLMIFKHQKPDNSK